MGELIPIPHKGRKPDWLEDDAQIIASGHAATAKNCTWEPFVNYYVPADHWAAPVLALGPNWLPWNPPLQGIKQPANWNGDAVMFRSGKVRHRPDPGVIWKLGWNWHYGSGDIIGYTSSAPASEHSGEAQGVEGGYWGPDADGDWTVTALGDAELWFSVPDEEKAKRIVAAIASREAELTRRLKLAEEAIDRALSCTPSIRYLPKVPSATIVYDCGDPWDILRAALAELREGRE